MTIRQIIAVGLAVFIFVLPGCGDKNFRKGQGALEHGKYRRAIVELSRAVKNDPTNAAHFRELGVAYFHLGNLGKATQALERARFFKPNDGRTLFFLGFCHELQGDLTKAIAIYSEYRQRLFFDSMQKQLQTRINRLTLRLAKSEIKDALVLEERETLVQPSPNTLAVLYFRNVSENGELQPLLKGLASVMTTDLGQIKSLRLVERIKLEALLNEIDLSTSDLYDRFTAPRAGRVVAAEHVIVGGATAIGSSHLQLNAGIVHSGTGAIVGKPVRVRGRLSDILKLEKRLVFSLIEQLDIRMSETERESIQILPTENTLAFVAFCRGLDYADSLKIPQARQAFEEAIRLDPNFEEAKQQLSDISSPSLADNQLIELATAETQQSKARRHLEATTRALQAPIETLRPLVPPSNTGRIVIKVKSPP